MTAGGTRRNVEKLSASNRASAARTPRHAIIENADQLCSSGRAGAGAAACRLILPEANKVRNARRRVAAANMK